MIYNFLSKLQVGLEFLKHIFYLDTSVSQNVKKILDVAA